MFGILIQFYIRQFSFRKKFKILNYSRSLYKEAHKEKYPTVDALSKTFTERVGDLRESEAPIK